MSTPPAATQARVRAPELDPSKTWLNTNRPLQISQLQGKVVLLDFWTYCCINCLHILPDLKRLEQKYPHELAVIGVHSAKFPNERRSENIQQAIRRYGIQHPVVNDDDFAIWQEYCVRAWPTQVLIDPEGYLVGQAAGEGNYDLLDKAIARLIEIHQAKGTLRRDHAEAQRRGEGEEGKEGEGRELCFPGKVLADEASGRLFIADSGGNRILVCGLQGEVGQVIGSGEASHRDGSFSQAGFHHPQGMALDDRWLYVADTDNHLIRCCDLESEQVRTIAGTGEQSRQMGYYGAGAPLETAISSPWDLERVNGELYIAMAGSHQIWFLDLQQSLLGPYAGSSREGCLDGLLPECALAQPSGLTSDGEHLYVADSEVSAIRAVPLDPEQPVWTVVGQDLFQFGDVDGKGDKVRLQHPLGVAFCGGWLYVADTYNHKIKRIDLRKRKSKTYLGTGEAGLQDGRKARFYEPSGVSLAGDLLFIADTNNHAVRVSPIGRRPAVETLQLKWGGRGERRTKERRTKEGRAPDWSSSNRSGSRPSN